ncbi:hypothetical protein H5410_057211 [Solanum commersonii]|uniref:Endonuclease/exonuclease/phosphatase domain-containing protein n=1 Tax=Solanum commersonii TaxID=4109 RepID=A0A9J5WP09_SOLCO|nr:hypothetical protein H5410_057211 [Solanum commersonii]
MIWHPRPEQHKDQVIKIANKFGTLTDNQEDVVGEREVRRFHLNLSMTDKVLFWNIRSVRTQNSFERLIELNKRHQHFYISILEPFQSLSDLDSYKARLGMQNSKDYNDILQQLKINFKLRGTSERFKVTTVYARCSALERLELWEDLEDIASNNTIPWIVRGDFNAINYTWWNDRLEEDINFRRLDRIFGNMEFMNLLPESEVQHLARQGSDHAPLHLIYNTYQEIALKHFRLLNFWTKHQKFNMWRIAGERKITTLEDVIKMNEIQLEISPTEANRPTLNKANAELKRYFKIEEEYWKQKAKME